MPETRWAALRAYLKRLLVIDAAVAAVTAGICWAIGWLSLGKYGLALILGALLLFGIMGMSSVGSTQYLKDPRYMLARSVGDKTLQERFREDLGHVRQSFDMSAMAGLVSLSLIGLGVLLMALA
jgi:hypothetical protein